MSGPLIRWCVWWSVSFTPPTRPKPMKSLESGHVESYVVLNGWFLKLTYVPQKQIHKFHLWWSYRKKSPKQQLATIQNPKCIHLTQIQTLFVSFLSPDAPGICPAVHLVGGMVQPFFKGAISDFWDVQIRLDGAKMVGHAYRYRSLKLGCVTQLFFCLWILYKIYHLYMNIYIYNYRYIYI